MATVLFYRPATIRRLKSQLNFSKRRKIKNSNKLEAIVAKNATAQIEERQKKQCAKNARRKFKSNPKDKILYFTIDKHFYKDYTVDNMLGRFILEQRKKHDLTQEYLASVLEISRPTYIQIEQGERDLTVTEAQKLSDIFGLSLEDFLAKKDNKVKVVLEKEKVLKSPEITIRVQRKNLNKFKQVLLYILEKVGSRPNIGETVLHKLLYFIDFDYYEKFEENLMGATYIKNHHGPTSVELGAIIKDMQDKKEIEAINSKYFKFDQKKYLPLRRPNLDILSAREKEHIDDILARLADKNAKEIESYSHGDIPWLSAKDGQKLSYESVFYRDEHYSVRTYDDEL